jgi:hypothetical protein
MDLKMPIDNRLHRRASTEFVAELYEADGRSLTGVARVLNLSEFGAGIESASPVPENTAVVIRLLLGKRHLLTLPARVKWMKQRVRVREYGLVFGEVPEMMKSLIRKFVEEYFSKEKPSTGRPPEI